MKTIGKMLGEVLSSVGKKPATVLYPFEKPVMPPKFRGKLKFTPERCAGCKLCVKDCPTGAIAINKIGDKKFEAVIDLDLCIYCGQCVDSCPKDALEMTLEYELAQLQRNKLRIVFRDTSQGDSNKKA